MFIFTFLDNIWLIFGNKNGKFSKKRTNELKQLIVAVVTAGLDEGHRKNSPLGSRARFRRISAVSKPNFASIYSYESL